MNGRWRGCLILILLTWCTQIMANEGGAEAGQCGAVALGAPCAQKGPANLPLGEGEDWRVGNPVHRLTGEKFQRDIDWHPLPGELGLEVVRHYRSSDPRDEGLGPGWRLSYDPRLYRVGDGWQITQVDGSLVRFHAAADSQALCFATDPLHGELHALEHGGHEWRWPNGRRLWFNPAGRLVRILAPSGATVHIQRGRIPGRDDYGRILSVEGPKGERLRLHYRHGRLTRILTPAGTLHYWVTGEPAWLRGVLYPNGQARLYLRGETGPSAVPVLTGVALLHPFAGVQPLWRYRYDEAGRVNTITAMAAGERHSQSVALAPTGAAAPHAFVNSAHSAAKPAEPSAQQAERPFQQTDALGRLVQLGEGKEAIHFEWWQGTHRLSAITRASHVAGRQRRVSIEWNKVPPNSGGGFPTESDDRSPIAASGAAPSVLPVAVTETGWAEASPEPLAVERRWRLHWQAAANGPPRLVRVQREGEAGGQVLTAASVPGWPGYQEQRDDLGRLLRWRSDATGETRVERPTPHKRRTHFANGDVWSEFFDPHGQLTELKRVSASHGADRIELQWSGKNEVRVVNPHEERRYIFTPYGEGGVTNNADSENVDSTTRLTIHVERPAYGPMPAWQYTDQLALDRWGRVHRHRLPEGGELRYYWSEQGRLRAIDWWPNANRRVALLRAEPQGYRLANGTRVRSLWQGGFLQRLQHEAHGRLVLGQALAYAPSGRLLSEQKRLAAGPSLQRHWQLNAKGQLQQVRGASETKETLAWLASGRRQREHPAAAPELADPSGLPTQYDGWSLTYGPGRQLVKASNGQYEIRWRRNALGEAIARWRVTRSGAPNSQAKVAGQLTDPQAEQSLYLRHRKVAHWGERGGRWGVLYRVVYAHEVPVAVIRYHEAAATDLRPGAAPRARVDTVHADALGVPVAVSDELGRLRWRAQFDTFGQLQGEWGDSSHGLALRLPGQWADPDTGWHFNYLRTYDPRRGHYLEPDPLGPQGSGPNSSWQGSSAYGYAGQRPHRWVDPTGLVLFAFDGTLQNAESAANVYRFSQWYRDGQALAAGLAESHYEPGPGGWPLIDLDAALGLSAADIVAAQWRQLIDHLYLLENTTEPVAFDLLGYSRGAALARHFGNRIAEQTRAGRFWFWDAALGDVTACVNLRFMGLFDTVAQFGLLGTADGAFDFSIDPAWQGVAHAVALNERRELYPLLSLAGPDGQLPPGALELPFVGAHADIGGGLVHPSSVVAPEVPLADVALEWMAERAEALGVQLERNESIAEGDWAWLHDLRTPIQRLNGWRLDEAGGPIPGVPQSDRAVLAHDGSAWLRSQGTHTLLGSTQRAQAEAWVERLDNWLTTGDSRVAKVRLGDYRAAGWHR